MIEFKFERIANMVFCTSDCGVVFYSWMDYEFTKRKMQNAIARIKSQYNGKVCFSFYGV